MKYLFIIVLTFNTVCLYSQEDYKPFPERTSGFYLGTGSGINNFNAAIGFSGEARIYNNLTLAAGAGVGLWGTKYAAALHYYRHYPYNTYFGLGYAYAAGMDTMLIPVNIDGDSVSVSQKPVGVVNLTIGYQFKLQMNLRLNVEMGYGIRLRKNPFEAYNPPDDEDFDENFRNYMGFLTPGGFILGVGISYGF